MGRPTKLSKEIQEHIVSSIRVGVGRDDAFLAAGIEKSTGYIWLKKGRAGDPRYVEFSEAVEKADAEFVRFGLITIATAAKKQWQAAAWMLERKKPAQFAQRVSLTVDEELNGFLNRLQAALPEETFRKVLDIATAATGSAAAGADSPGGSEGEGTEGEGSPSAG